MNKNFNFEIAGSQFVTKEGKLVGPFEKLKELVLHNTLNIWKCKTTGKHYCESGAEVDIETKKAFYNTKKSTILRQATAIENRSKTKDKKTYKQIDEFNNLFKMKSPKLNPECDCPSCQSSRLSLSNGINTTLVNNIFAVYNYMIDGLKVDKFVLIDLPDMEKTPVLLQKIILKKLLKDYSKYSNNDTKTLESLIDIEYNLSDALIEKFFIIDDFLKQHNIMSKAEKKKKKINFQLMNKIIWMNYHLLIFYITKVKICLMNQKKNILILLCLQ